MRTLIAILLLGISLCLYSSNSNVVKLTSSNFQREVIDSSDIWLVEFYGKYLLISSLVWSLQKSCS